MKITKNEFGMTKDNQPISLYTIENASGASVTLSDYGCRIIKIMVPNKEGKLTDVILGLMNADEYLADDASLGAVVGRCANRIAKGHFTLNDKEYNLAINNGPNHLHGGPTGFAQRVWTGKVTDDKVTFTRISPDGEEGYPGNLTVSVTYGWSEDNELSIVYEASCDQERFLENRILARCFIRKLEQGMYYADALKIFGKRGISKEIFKLLMEDAAEADFSLKIRIYHAVSCYMKKTRTIYDDLHYDALENDCFGTIQEVIYEEAEKKLPDSAGYRIVKDQVDIALPVRVNWGGGWTDTPPHCNEKGGVVLNAAMKLRGIYPVQITVKRLDELHVEFESKDIGVYTTVDSAAEIQDCHNPYDSFALHKAALIACGIIPVREEADLQEILKRMGGGIYLSTQVYGVPKGSGLGTSSILSGACVKGIFEFLGQERTDAEIYDVVLGMEQIMSTGGGWQDQVGGLTEGIKLISTKPGIAQNLVVEKIEMPEEGKKELKERFALIYTGQRRLARNLLRDVVGGYIGSRPESLKALKEMKAVAVLMRFALEQGDIDEFAELLNQHWKLSCMLDAGTTNTCIDQILLVCEDLIDGKFISGAGGGGFIQVILKKDVTKEQLHERLHGVFQDSGVDVWDCELLV